MTLVVHGGSDLNTLVTWAGEPELVDEYLIAPKLEPELVDEYLIAPKLEPELVGDYLIASELELELVLFYSGSTALVWTPLT